MITIREMEIDDISEVAAIEASLFSMPWGEVGFFSFLMREDTLFLVAEEKGEVLGYCGIVAVMDEGDIVKVAVAKKSQNQGIGTMLMDELIRTAADQGVTRLFLEVRAGNPGAIHLYKKSGFVQTGIRKNYYEELGEDALVMMRES